MFPLFTWWSKLGIEAVEPIAAPGTTAEERAAARGKDKRGLRQHPGCPRGDDPLVHQPTDAVCAVHDRLLLFSDLDPWDQQLRRLLAHVPVYLGVVVAVLEGARWLLAGVSLVVAAWFARIHVRRLKVARRWTVACLLVSALVAAWASLPANDATWAGSAPWLALAAFLLVLQYTRRTVGVRAATDLIPSSPSSHLWVDPDGVAQRSGVRACACAVVAAGSLAAAVVTWGRGEPRAASRFLGAAVIAAVVGVIVLMVAAAVARDADRVVREDGPRAPTWLDEPPHWQALRPWPRSFRRFFLRVRRAVAEVLPFLDGPDEPLTAPGSAVTVGDRLVASVPDVLRRSASAVAAGLRRAVLPMAAAAAVVVCSVRAGLALADAVRGVGGAATLLTLAACTGATGAAVAALVWAVTGVPGGVAAGSVLRSVLVLSPWTMVQLLVAILLSVVLAGLQHGWRAPPALFWVVSGLVAAQVAVPTVRRWM